MRLALALALVVTSTAAFAGPATDAVEFFYKDIGAEYDPLYLDRFLDPARAVLAAHQKSEEPCLDFGLATDAQDYDDVELAKSLKFAEDVAGHEATVTASFRLFADDPEADKEIVWSLRKVGSAWKISDIGQANGSWRLSEFKCE